MPLLILFLGLRLFCQVAQYPEELVTYGGNGSVFSNWFVTDCKTLVFECNLGLQHLSHTAQHSTRTLQCNRVITSASPNLVGGRGFGGRSNFESSSGSDERCRPFTNNLKLSSYWSGEGSAFIASQNTHSQISRKDRPHIPRTTTRAHTHTHTRSTSNY